MKDEIVRLGGAYGQATRWGVYSVMGICPTIVASMGEGGGHTPMIIVKDEINGNVESNSEME